MKIRTVNGILQPGDTIITFDNRPVSSPGDAMDLYNKIKKGQAMKLLIERNGEYALISTSKNQSSQ